MDLLLRAALAQLNRPYIWGGDDPMTGWDCSGLVQEILATAGLDPPGDQNAQGLFNYFEKTAAWNKYALGSLAFYGQSVTKITHVAFLIDQYRVIEAGGGGSACTSELEAKHLNAYVRIRPVNRRQDLVAVIKPSYAPIGMP